jgi:predicted RNase H-like nuclease (RuvC/YqgF family)
MENEPEQAAEVELTVSETDSLKLENETLQRELKSRGETIAGLEKTLADRDTEITALKQSMDETGRQLNEMGRALPQAVAAYKELVVQANPGLVGEMIKGDTIEAINESAASAKALVARVKQEVGAENARVRVPAGAPQRTPPDFAALSAREKIQLAMEGKK